MKAIKVNEVRAIKREFDLTEQEGWYLEDLADDVNRAKAQKNVGYLRLDMISQDVAEMLKVRVCQVRQWFVNIGANQRFGKHVVVATQFGQNYLEIAA